MTIDELQELDPLGRKLRALRDEHVTVPFDRAHALVKLWDMPPCPRRWQPAPDDPKMSDADVREFVGWHT